MLEKKNENWKMLRDSRVDREVGRVNIDNQLKMSEWKVILIGIRYKDVKVQYKVREDEVLAVYKAFVGRLVRNIMVIVRSQEIDGQCLKILNRREAGSRGDRRKMYVRHIVSTIDQYIKVWKMLLRVIQKMQKGKISRESKGKVFKERPGFVLGRGERDVLVLIEEKGKELVKVQRKKKGMYSRDGKRGQKDKEVVRVGGELEEYVLGVQIELLGVGLVGNGRKSVFVCRLACLGLNLKDGGQKEVDGCIQLYAAVLMVGKLFMLYNCQLKRKKEVDYLVVKRGMSEEDVELEVESLVERLNKQARKYLFSKVAAVKGKVRMLELLMDQISYRKAIKIREKEWQSKVQQLRDLDGVEVSLFKKGIRLRMDRVKGMVQDLLGDLEERMESELLFVRGQDLEGKGLIVDMNLLVDDQRRKTIRYLFITDKRNKGVNRGVLGLDRSRQLLKRVIREKKLRGKFIVRRVVDGGEEWDFNSRKQDG